MPAGEPAHPGRRMKNSSKPFAPINRAIIASLSLFVFALPAHAGPFIYPGPSGADGKWGVRTYLNQGINAAEDLATVLAFLSDPSTAGRTPATSPGNTVDAQVPYLSFLDPQTNVPGGVFPQIGRASCRERGVDRGGRG